MEDKVRILVCHTDGAVYELPWYSGPPEHDDTLNYRLAGHENHIGNLFTVRASDWNKQSYRDAIIKEIATKVGAPGSGAGMGSEFYDLKSNFQQDAITCWKGFNRTTDPGHCDYRKDNKRLYPDTKADRKEAGMPKERPNTFLCDFCPVHSLVQQQQRKKAGLYD